MSKSPLRTNVGVLGQGDPSQEFPVVRHGWKEFRDTGLFWLLNRTLHVFGWAIVMVADDAGEIVEVFPARVVYRGFTEDAEQSGFQNISKYMVEKAYALRKEAVG